MVVFVSIVKTEDKETQNTVDECGVKGKAV